MKRILISSSLVLVLSGGLAFAQSTAAPSPTTTDTGRHHGHHSRDPQRQAAWLSKKLNLSPDQTAKLEPILVDRNQKIAALRSNTSLSPEELKQQRRAIHQDIKQQLATVLTPDQIQQMESLHHRHGSPAQAQPLPIPPSGF
ncbi:MAG TPA: hypothetical protein VK578_10040 [Edaphobacter sp.]|nr:hypothetical protein [Edaphobacter sp.]